MCRVLRVHFSGFQAWLEKPLGYRALEDARQTELIRQARSESGNAYGYPLAGRCLTVNACIHLTANGLPAITVRRKLTDDRRDQGETCSENRVARLASLAGIAARIGYKRRPGRYGGKPAVVVTNTLDRQFGVAAPDKVVAAPDKVWGEPLYAIGSRTMASDITYIKTHEGWLYLAVVIDLFSRRVVGPLSQFACKPLPGSGSAQPRMTTDLALHALLAAVWRRKPKTKVMIHSDQGSPFTSREWQVFPGQHNLEAGMSRRGNCHDNAAAESFFQLLKQERLRRRTYLTREAARQDVFDYIEMFYNPKRKHTNNAMLSPVDFETRQQKLNEAGVWKTKGTSVIKTIRVHTSPY